MEDLPNIPFDLTNYTGIPDKYPSYDSRAYDFVLYVIGEACTMREGHVSAQELLGVFRDEALDAFGPMAYAVLSDWGVKCSLDVGNIVFSLYDAKFIGKRDEDSLSDFIDGYDFEETFLSPYLNP